MKTSRKKRIRLLWAELILSTAEKLPLFQGGAVKMLQERRRRLREQADHELEIYRLPPGLQIFPKSFTFTLLYPLEESLSLSRSLKKTFPSTEAMEIEPWSFGVEQSASDLLSASWQLVGDLSRSRSGFTRSHRQIKDLPMEVKHIEVRIYKILPSMHAVCFRVRLSDQVGTHLTELYSRMYLPKAIFRDWIPSGKKAFFMGHGNAASVMKAATLGYLRDIESRTREALRRWFTDPQMMEGTVPPTVREIHLKLTLPVDVEADSQKRVGRMWTSGIGLDSYNWRRFEFDEYKVAFDERRGIENLACTFLVGQDPSYRRESKDQELSFSLALMLGIEGLLLTNVNALSRLREQIYSRALRKRRVRILSTDIRLNESIQLHTFIAKRLQTELLLGSNLIEDWTGELKRFVGIDKHQQDLFSAFKLRYIHLSKLLREHNSLVSSISQSNLQNRSLAATHRLSRYVLLLTVVATLMTVFAGFSNVDSSLKWLKDHLHISRSK